MKESNPFSVSSAVNTLGSCVFNVPKLTCGVAYQHKAACHDVGCCWDDANDTCYVSEASEYLIDINTDISDYDNSTQNAFLTLNQPNSVHFGMDYEELNLKIIQETPSRTRIRIDPTSHSKEHTNPLDTLWEIPESIITRPGGRYTGGEQQTNTVMKSTENGFEIITRRIESNSEDDFIFKFTQLIFQEQYLQFVLEKPKNIVASYGLGESSRLKQQLQEDTIYTLWNSDWPAASFNHSAYGFHPLLIQVADNGLAHGILFMNGYGMDVTVDAAHIGYQTIGGIVDVYVFSGATPSDVVSQYLDVVGRPAMVPYWSLGFHNCRWGYESMSEIKEVVANYTAAGLPLETQWVDIDYMDRYLDFTLDPKTYSKEDTADLIDTLHANGQRFVPIIDPGIYMADNNYSSYQNAIELNIFVKDLLGKDNYLAQVWPGPVHFPDWFAENTTKYWESELARFYEESMQFDGMWIDMNEPSNFCNYNGHGQVCFLREHMKCAINLCCLNCTTVDDANKLDFAAFVPHTAMNTLGGRTLPMSAQHAGALSEYAVHNLYGFMESVATRAALIGIRKERPFLLSRSTFMGSGAHTAHWTGDNAATWDDLAVSIVTMNNMALFGISMIGADICGFNGDTTEELCARWIEVGAFSPFSRDHNIRLAAPQELYRWDSVTRASKRVLTIRYEYLSTLYTYMFRAFTVGSTVHNAMWMHFPSDANTFKQDAQFMWSDAILFTPVITADKTVVEGYFPNGLWFNLFDMEADRVSPLIRSHALATIDGVEVEVGTYVSLYTPLEATNVHLRGGRIITKQHFFNTTEMVRQSPTSLVVALDSSKTARGNLYVDDGIQIELTDYSNISYEASNNILKSMVENVYTSPGSNNAKGDVPNGVYLDKIIIYEAYDDSSSDKANEVLETCTGRLQYESAAVSGLNMEMVGVLTPYDDMKVMTFDIYGARSHSDNNISTLLYNFEFSWKCE